MSKFSTHHLICPHCNHEFDVELADSLNSDLSSDALNRIISGADYIIKCPNCHKEEIFEHSILYHDMSKKFMVCYVPDIRSMYEYIKTFESIKNEFSNLYMDYILRIVIGNYERFVEKISILNSGENDVVIEFMKRLIIEQTNFENKYTLYLNYNSAENYKEFIFVSNETYEVEKVMDFEIGKYEEVLNSLKDKIFFDRDNDYLVDESFVQAMLTNYLDSEPIHMEFFREKRRVILVKIHELNKNVYYEADEDEEPNTLLKVPYKDNEYEATVLKQFYLSEKALGFSFDKLKKPTQVRFNTEAMVGIFEKHLIPLAYDGIRMYYYDVNLDLDMFNKYILDEIILSEKNIYACSNLKKLERNTRLVILSNHPADHGTVDNENMVVFDRGYYKVLDKYCLNDKQFIILLHLPTSHWIQYGIMSMSLTMPNGDNFKSLIKDKVNDKSFTSNETLTTNVYDCFSESLGKIDDEIKIVKSYAILD